MGVIVTPQQQIDKYFESEDLSQSTLKKLINGFDSFLSNQETESDLYYKEKGNLVIGSAVDCILTGEEDAFSKQFYISQIETKPSEVEMSIIQMVFDDVVESLNSTQNIMNLDDEVLSNCIGSIEMAVNEHNWQSRWKTDTRVNKIVEVGTEYFEDLKRAYGKQIISESQYQLINDIVESLKMNPNTGKYFDRGLFKNKTNIDVYYQLPIYFNYKYTHCKALLDIVIVHKDENNNIFKVQPIDLKTMYGNTVDFINSVKRFRYDIQASWYTLALDNWITNSTTLNFAEQVIVEPFMFIVESNSNPGKPLVYKLNSEMLQYGKFGRPELKSTDLPWSASFDVILSKQIKGYEDLIDDYIYYCNNEWGENRVLAERGDILELSWNGIV